MNITLSMNSKSTHAWQVFGGVLAVFVELYLQTPCWIIEDMHILSQALFKLQDGTKFMQGDKKVLEFSAPYLQAVHRSGCKDQLPQDRQCSFTIAEWYDESKFKIIRQKRLKSPTEVAAAAKSDRKLRLLNFELSFFHKIAVYCHLLYDCQVIIEPSCRTLVGKVPLAICF